jgi:hypothetical protein
MEAVGRDNGSTRRPALSRPRVDRRPGSHPVAIPCSLSSLRACVSNERHVAALGFQAVAGQRGYFFGSPACVAQHHVDRLIHRLQVFGREHPGPGGIATAQQVQVGVELADHLLRDRLADLVLVGLGRRDLVCGGVTGERPGQRVEEAGAATEVQ